MTDAQKRQHLTMRVTQDMGDRIDAAAAKNGRSRSQEIELRLEHSLRADDGVGGSTQSDLLRRLQLSMDIASAVVGEPWWSNHIAWRFIRDLYQSILQSYEPAGEAVQGLISDDGLAEISAWEERASGRKLTILRLIVERQQLELLDRLLGLSPSEAARLNEITEALKIEQVELPALEERDMNAWLKMEGNNLTEVRLQNAILPLVSATLAKRRKVRAKPKPIGSRPSRRSR